MWNPAKDWVGWLLIASLVGGSIWGYFHPRGNPHGDLIHRFLREVGQQELGIPPYWKAIAPYMGQVSIYDGPGTFCRQFEKVPPAAGHILAANWCQSQVAAGGFEQFFSTSTGVLAPEAVAGFRAMGLPDLAEVVEQAMDVFPEPYPRDRDIRNEVLGQKLSARQNDLFGKLDRKFVELLSSSDGETSDRFEAAANRYAQEKLGL